MSVFSRKEKVTAEHLGLLLVPPAIQIAVDETSETSLISMLRQTDNPRVEDPMIQTEMIIYSLHLFLTLAAKHHREHFPRIEKAARACLSSYVSHNQPDAKGFDWSKFNDHVLRRLGQYARHLDLARESAVGYGMRIGEIIFGEEEKDIRLGMTLGAFFAAGLSSMEGMLQSFRIKTVSTPDDAKIEALVDGWFIEYRIS